MTSLLITEGGDLAIEDGDLVQDQSFASAVLVSLFCDARAEDVTPELQRGYWADDGADRVGSLLWLLGRSKATNATAAQARDHARRSLTWLVDEGIAASVEVEARFERRGFLVIDVAIGRPGSGRYENLWDGFEAFERSLPLGAIRVRGI